MESKVPHVTFEQIDPKDLASAVATLENPQRQLADLPPIGLGYDRFLQWAVADILEAKAATESDACSRHSVNAVMHGRRALSCLADQYLKRDGLSYCRNRPSRVDKI